MPSGPSLFDDEDGLEADTGSPPHESGAASDDVRDAASARRRSPNYLIRRAVVVGGVVAVLATASVVIGQLMGSDTDDAGSGAISTDWNRIVLVDDRTGRVIIDDAEGEEQSRIESGVRSPTDSAAVDSSLVVTNDDLVAVIDLADERVDEYDVGASAIVGPAGSALTMIAPRPDGGRAILVHGPSGEVIDTDTFAPVVGERYEFADARSSTSGRDVLVTDSGNFQSVLFSFDRDEPSFFPGLALAVNADLIVTAQNVGADATINVFDHNGEPIATGRTPSVRAGMITASGVVLVTVDGEVVIMSSSDGEVSEVGQLDVGTVESGSVATNGERLVITGTAGTALIDASAEVVTTLDEQRPTGDGQPPTASTCIATITTADDADSQVSLIALADGNVVVEAVGDEPVLADASGCVAGSSTSDGYDLFDADGVEPFPTGDTLLAIALDGRSIVAERGARLVLLGVAGDDDTDDAEDPIDLGPRSRNVHFTQL